MFNIFRLAGDLVHMLATVLLIRRVCYEQEARGVSLKTQQFYLLVFCTRYLDLFTTFYSMYNSCVKVLYIFTSLLIVKTLMYPSGRLESTFTSQENFPRPWLYLVLPCSVVAFVIHWIGSRMYGGFDLLELLWTFSIALESVAMVPQLVIMHSSRGSWEPVLDKYVFCMWLYRTLYIINWVCRSLTERNYRHHFFVYFCGVLQSGINGSTWIIRKIIYSRYIHTEEENGFDVDGRQEEEGGEEEEAELDYSLLLNEGSDTQPDHSTDEPISVPTEDNNQGNESSRKETVPIVWIR